MSNFLMPSLGADMEAGTLVEKIAAAGAAVKRGDVIAAVETQKGVIEIEVFEDGILEEWLASIGDEVPVGTALAVIKAPGKADDSAPSDARTTPDTDDAAAPVAPPVSPDFPSVSRPHPRRRKVTPAARRLARERGIDLNALDISPEIPITRAHVQAAAAAPPPASPADDIRRAIAAAMSRSKREIPHYYLSHDVDMTVLDSFLSALNAERPPETRVLAGAVYAAAISKALKKFPEFNGHYLDDRFHPSDAINLGFAINLRTGGLVAPALFQTETCDLDKLMGNLRDLVGRVRAGRFRARELSDATITLTSLGERGTDQLYGVIYPPQVAIVGIGTPRLRPWVHEHKIMPRLMATITLAADHRVSDGHRGALFLRKIESYLQEPEHL